MGLFYQPRYLDALAEVFRRILIGRIFFRTCIRQASRSTSACRISATLSTFCFSALCVTFRERSRLAFYSVLYHLQQTELAVGNLRRQHTGNIQLPERVHNLYKFSLFRFHKILRSAAAHTKIISYHTMHTPATLLPEAIFNTVNYFQTKLILAPEIKEVNGNYMKKMYT